MVVRCVNPDYSVAAPFRAIAEHHLNNLEWLYSLKELSKHCKHPQNNLVHVNDMVLLVVFVGVLVG